MKRVPIGVDHNPLDDDPAPGARTDRWWIRPLVLVALLGIGVAAAVSVGIPPVEDIRAWVGAAGWAGPVAFAGLYAVLALTPAPATVLSIAAGVLFGLAGGLAVVVAGPYSARWGRSGCPAAWGGAPWSGSTTTGCAASTRCCAAAACSP